MPPQEGPPVHRRMPEAPSPAAMLTRPGVGQQPDTSVTMSHDTAFPFAKFGGARHDSQDRKRPQCIAHRGYRAKFPENSMLAFREAVKAGAHALETDIHLTKDDVVVLSHDRNLQRCFGVPDRILDKTWAEIRDLRTVMKPHVAMPRLSDVLEYLAEPGLEDVWLMLDIKLDNEADKVMRLIGSTLDSASDGDKPAWKDRVVLGIWAAKYLTLAQQYSPGYPVCHIGFSTIFARYFFEFPHVGLSIRFVSLISPWGRMFLRDARDKHHRQVYSWTVNTEKRMRWCVRRGLAGVITDDPALFRKVCKDFDDGEPEQLFALDLKAYYELVQLWVFLVLFKWPLLKQLRPVASQELIRKKT